ncbi:MAG: hypothetical protein CO090_02335 [Acidobacteria bacterium CG_4_9_14_3_um_filter_49_7]|nr:MAG: hypothetical protein CO090_02335 [Acidobacteria bacterium CG_4_9_14_3_um_filter_49_7]
MNDRGLPVEELLNVKRVLLMDTLSTIHVGNGALLENTIKLCNEAFGPCEIHIITTDIETNKLRYDKLHNSMFGTFASGRGRIGKIAWLVKEAFFIFLQIANELTVRFSSRRLAFNDDQKNAIRAIEDCDVCVSCGGEVLLDTYFKTLPFWLFTYWLAIRKHKTFILFPQSVGPLKKRWTRALVRLALKNATLLVGRDKPSCETLSSLGFHQKQVMYAPDVAIFQEAGTCDVHSCFSDRNKKVVGVTVSRPPFHEMGAEVDLVSGIGAQIEKLSPSEFKVLIMPSNYIRDGISTDYALCLQLKDRLLSRFETAILENRPWFPDEYTAMLEGLEFFISTRMHVTILATTVGIPAIAINTQHKIRGYMENIKMEQFCLEYDEIGRIFELSQEIISNRVAISDELKKANASLKKEYEPFIRKLREISP